MKLDENIQARVQEAQRLLKGPQEDLVAWLMADDEQTKALMEDIKRLEGEAA